MTKNLISAAAISVPAPPPYRREIPAAPSPPDNQVATWTNAQWEAFHDDLDRLLDACGPTANRNEQAVVLISACIEAGINNLGQIIKVLEPLGFKRGHLASILTKGKAPPWARDAAGTFSLLPK